MCKHVGWVTSQTVLGGCLEMQLSTRMYGKSEGGRFVELFGTFAYGGFVSDKTKDSSFPPPAQKEKIKTKYF